MRILSTYANEKILLYIKSKVDNIYNILLFVKEEIKYTLLFACIYIKKHWKNI